MESQQARSPSLISSSSNPSGEKKEPYNPFNTARSPSSNPFSSLSSLKRSGSSPSLVPKITVEEPKTVATLLFKLIEHRDHAKENLLSSWGLTQLINSFNTSAGYNLDDLEQTILFDDLDSVVTMLDAAKALVNKQRDVVSGYQTGEDISVIQKRFRDTMQIVCNRMEANLTSKRDIAINVGIGLGAVALGVAVGITTAVALGATIAFAPIIVSALVVTALLLLTAAAIAHVHQKNHTFFGQNLQSHKLMADLVEAKADLLDPKKLIRV